MTRPARAPKQSPRASPKVSQKQQPTPVDPAEPIILMKPRPKLFYALLVVFLIWIGFLVTLYFTTVFEKTDVHIQSTSTRAGA